MATTKNQSGTSPARVTLAAGSSIDEEVRAEVQPARRRLEDALLGPRRARQWVFERVFTPRGTVLPAPARSLATVPSAARGLGVHGSGPHEGSSISAHFSGDVTDLSVADLIQMLHWTGKDAVISIEVGECQSRLWCSAGAVIDAESGLLSGEGAVYRILGFDRGRVLAELRTVQRVQTIFADTQHLLLEAARRKDECAFLRQKFGDGSRLYRVGERIAPESVQSEAERDLLGSLGGPRAVEDVVESSQLSDLEAWQVLARWLDAGLLVDAGTRGEATPGIAQSSGIPVAEPSDLRTNLVRRLGSSRSPANGSRAAHQQWSRPIVVQAGSAIAALVTISCVYLLGGGTSLLGRASSTRKPAPAVAREPLQAEEYVLDLSVWPREGEILLDRSTVAQGHLQRRLVRDGLSHEVRITARGFSPAHLFFVDVAPQKEVRLEPLPSMCDDKSRPTDPSNGATPALPPLEETANNRRRSARTMLDQRGYAPESVRKKSPLPAPPSTVKASLEAEGHPRQRARADEPLVQIIE